MTKIKHHLTEELLMGYAAGQLPEAFNLVVATHISMCDDCRAALAAYEALGGELLSARTDTEMAEDALASTLKRIAETPPEVAKTLPSSVGTGIFPAPLRDYVKGDVEAVKWRRIGGGVSQMVLSTSSSATVRLLHIPAGTEVPDHGHRGTELTLVLQGAFKDETDQFGVGDLEVANEDLNHTPVADMGADCICLAATDAPLKFNGLLPRMVQRFVGI